MPYVYAFDHKHRKPPREKKGLLGGKGANLAEMTSVLGLPVPPGFTITTDACREYMHSGWPDGLDDEVRKHLRKLEKAMDKELGDPDDPLLVSVRSGAKFSMPGMMDTVLNLGLNDRSVQGLAKQTDDERFAFDSYRRFIQMFAKIVLDVDGDQFEHLLDTARELDGAATDADISTETLNKLCQRFKQIVKDQTGRAFPQDPQQQLRMAIEAVFSSWNAPRAFAYRNREKLSHDLGTAVNVQTMVFGNRDENSGTGVGFTRNPATGENAPYGDFLVNAQGEDVVAGIRITEDLSAMADRWPKLHKQLLGIFDKLEKHYHDMCDTEFTVEQGKLWMLQTRIGKRTGRAALTMAVEMTKGRKWKISREEALQRITADHVDSVLHPQVSDADHTVLATGLAASPGAGVGRAYFSADAAAEAAAGGEKVILVRPETSPDDIHGMAAAEGILTSKGGLVSHAAVVARGWGKPAVCGADDIKIRGNRFTVVVPDGKGKTEAITVEEGQPITIDGTTGNVILGEAEVVAGEAPPELEQILKWADQVRKGKLAVRANADTGEDAARAREFGAEGIGLCRTEHMFLGEDRLPVVRQMIMADTPEEEAAALEELRKVQRDDFAEVLEAMDGLPVTIRLLDPPLHEFLPHTEELAVKEATEGLTAEETDLLAAARRWEEVNPMLGTRGVRLGVLKPGLYAMQVRALMEAAVQRAKDGGKPVIEIMIPLTVNREEMAEARRWVDDAVAEATKKVKRPIDVTIGTMIETPRAALRADEIAEEADFFSFGTNDLTQMTFGFSRDDVAARMMPAYFEAGLLTRDPFETVDAGGVGELVKLAVERGRSTRPDIKLGVCGEHGGDPESIALFHEAGLHYVSCSPFRVPIARLAAAQAIVGADDQSK